jgi:hypothetical protein
MTGDYEVFSSSAGSERNRFASDVYAPTEPAARWEPAVVEYAASRLTSRVTSVAIIDDDDGIRAVRGALVRYDVLTCVWRRS